MITNVKSGHLKDEKDFTISLIRFLSMLFIITCHIFQYAGNNLASVLNVGVEIFLIISGFLYGTKLIGHHYHFFKRQGVKILLPCWVFLSISLILYVIYFPKLLDVNVLKVFTTLDFIKGLEHLWFIRYILICYCILPLLIFIRDTTLKYNFNIVYVMILTMLLMELYRFFVGSYINCFVLGFFIKNIIDLYGTTAKRTLLATVLSLTLIVQFVNIAFFSIDGNNHFLVVRYSHLLLGASLFLILHISIKIKKQVNILLFSDKCSYHIYLVHQLFILSPFTIMELTPFCAVNILLVYFCSFLGGYLLYKISQRISMML